MKAFIKGREAILRMTKDENGVVSFEYLIVAACIVAAVAAAFGGTAAGSITAGLKTGIGDIVAALGTAVTAA